ncbi:tripartite motif-containing protein 3-like [Magallana gigas]|uniref:tripartite motif-containing protein 3-like n=1 Tax=Magallana gigas TaxID=29159 RepID=UPI0033411F8D
MNLENSLQDVARCHHCEAPGPSLHCDICNKHVCKDCEKEHVSDQLNMHKLVPFTLRGCITICKLHSSQICDQLCEKCLIPICVVCASKKHQGHGFSDVVVKLEQKRKDFKRDLEELEIIHPKLKEIAVYTINQTANLNKNYRKLTTAIDKHGEDLRSVIDVIILKFKSDVFDMKQKHLDVLNKQGEEIKRRISEMEQIITHLNDLLYSKNVSVVSAYKSKNAEFRRLPPKLTVTFPSFAPQKIKREQCGSLSTYRTIRTEDHGYDSSGAKSSLPDIIEKQQIISEINTEYGSNNGLCSVSCLNDQQVWTCSFYDKIMKLYDTHGELLKSIETKSGNYPRDIAMKKNGDLIYADYDERTVNIVKNTQIETVIRLWIWRPLSVCTTSSNDLLVVMICDDDEQTKVVRYSGSSEKQSIQYSDKGELLYSSGDIKYITENSNLDICVSECEAGAVVVVNKAGEFRFTYSGPNFSSKESFIPYGITTDSRSQILIVDSSNLNIHVLNKDGQFLRYIDISHLNRPSGICVDTKNNLFVAETVHVTGKVKKIQYIM